MCVHRRAVAAHERGTTPIISPPTTGSTLISVGLVAVVLVAAAGQVAAAGGSDAELASIEVVRSPATSGNWACAQRRVSGGRSDRDQIEIRSRSDRASWLRVARWTQDHAVVGPHDPL